AYARYLVNHLAPPPIQKSPDDSNASYGIDQMSGNPPLYYALVALATAPVPDADNVAPYLVSNRFATAYDIYAMPFDNHVTYLHGHEARFPWHGAALAVHIGRL